MPAFTLYLALHHAGMNLGTDGQKLTVTPANLLNEQLRVGIRQHKPGLIELLRSAHHTTGRLLDWAVSLDPDTSAATAIQFRSASLNLDAQLPDRTANVPHESRTAIPQPKAHHDRTE